MFWTVSGLNALLTEMELTISRYFKSDTKEQTTSDFF